jgi:hypothetical protein
MVMMKALTNNALAAGVVIAIFGTVINSIATYRISQSIEASKTAIEKVVRFETSNKEVVERARDFIGAVNDKKDLTAVRSKFVGALISQMVDSTGLRPTSGTRLHTVVAEYQSSILELRKVTESVNSVTDMPRWIEAFSLVLERKDEVARTLQAA